MNPQSLRPILDPVATTRDAEGRLIGLTLHYGQVTKPSGANVWLVAVDGSGHSHHAVAEAIRLAATMPDCSLHVLNVQHWMSKEAAETELMTQGLAATDGAWALLDAAGVPWCLHITMGEVAESIVAQAESLGCHGIVIGTRGLGTAENLLLGSVSHKVIHQSRVAVLVVR